MRSVQIWHEALWKTCFYLIEFQLRLKHYKDYSNKIDDGSIMESPLTLKTVPLCSVPYQRFV